MHAKLFVELLPADVKAGTYGCSRQLVTILSPQSLVQMDISEENWWVSWGISRNHFNFRMTEWVVTISLRIHWCKYQFPLEKQSSTCVGTLKCQFVQLPPAFNRKYHLISNRRLTADKTNHKIEKLDDFSVGLKHHGNLIKQTSSAFAFDSRRPIIFVLGNLTEVETVI